VEEVVGRTVGFHQMIEIKAKRKKKIMMMIRRRGRRVRRWKYRRAPVRLPAQQ